MSLKLILILLLSLSYENVRFTCTCTKAIIIKCFLVHLKEEDNIFPVMIN